VRYIYALCDPRNNRIRYVGKADNVKKRVQNHMCPSNLKRKNRHVCQWLSSLVKLGVRPDVKILEILESDSDWEQIEKKWISHFRNIGLDLTNITDGGEGGATYGRLNKPWTDQHRINYRKSRKGMKVTSLSPESLERRGVAIKKHWDEVRAAGGKKKGPVHTVESKLKLSEAHKGKVLSEEHKRKLSEAHKGNSLSLEHRKKIGESNRGKKRFPLSEEHRAKLREAWIRRKQHSQKEARY
jgi:hypothetical protein